MIIIYIYYSSSHNRSCEYVDSGLKITKGKDIHQQ